MTVQDDASLKKVLEAGSIEQPVLKDDTHTVVRVWWRRTTSVILSVVIQLFVVALGQLVNTMNLMDQIWGVIVDEIISIINELFAVDIIDAMDDMINDPLADRNNVTVDVVRNARLKAFVRVEKSDESTLTASEDDRNESSQIKQHMKEMPLMKNTSKEPKSEIKSNKLTRSQREFLDKLVNNSKISKLEDNKDRPCIQIITNTSQTNLPPPAIERQTEKRRNALSATNPFTPRTAAARPVISRRADRCERMRFVSDEEQPTVGLPEIADSPKTTGSRGETVAKKRGRDVTLPRTKTYFPSLTETTTRRHAQNAVDSITPNKACDRQIVSRHADKSANRKRERFFGDAPPPAVSTPKTTGSRGGVVVEKRGRDVTSLWTKADFPSLAETTTRPHVKNAVHSVTPSKDSARQTIFSRHADKSAKRKRERFSGDRVPPTPSSPTTENSPIITGGRGHAAAKKCGHKVIPPQTTPDFRGLTATTSQPPVEDDDAW